MDTCIDRDEDGDKSGDGDGDGDGDREKDREKGRDIDEEDEGIRQQQRQQQQQHSVFLSPFQDAPLDLDIPYLFYEKRRAHLEARFRCLSIASPSVIAKVSIYPSIHLFIHPSINLAI